MTNSYYLINGPQYINEVYNIGQRVIRIGKTKLDKYEIIKGYKQIGTVVNVKRINYANKVYHVYYVQFYDNATYEPLYGRAIPILGHDLMKYNPNREMGYYYDVMRNHNEYVKKVPMVYNTIYPNIQKEVSYLPTERSKTLFKSGDRVIKRGNRYGNIAYNRVGIVVNTIADSRISHSKTEHNQICVVNFRNDLDLIIVPSKDLQLIERGKTRYIVIKNKNKQIRLSNDSCFIIGQNAQMDQEIAETLYLFSSFDYNKNTLNVDSENFEIIKKLSDDLVK